MLLGDLGEAFADGITLAILAEAKKIPEKFLFGLGLRTVKYWGGTGGAHTILGLFQRAICGSLQAETVG